MTPEQVKSLRPGDLVQLARSPVKSVVGYMFHVHAVDPDGNHVSLLLDAELQRRQKRAGIKNGHPIGRVYFARAENIEAVRGSGIFSASMLWLKSR